MVSVRDKTFMTDNELTHERMQSQTGLSYAEREGGRLSQLTYQIRGAIFEVYNALGPGLLESVYEEALVFELQQQGLQVARQMEVPISYKGNCLKTTLRLDLLIENRIIVELKSVEEMKPVFAKQLLTYLRLLDKRIGLLVNFSSNNIREGIIRIVN